MTEFYVASPGKNEQITLLRGGIGYSVFQSCNPKIIALWWFREVKDTVLILKPIREMELAGEWYHNS